MNFRAWSGGVEMSEKLTGMLLGVIITVTILSAFGLVMAHLNDGDTTEADNGVSEPGHMSMGSGMMMMHGMYEDDHDEMHEHCPMMEGIEHHENMSLEEMDKDGDGLCDFCGMSIESCLSMHESMHESGEMMGCHA